MKTLLCVVILCFGLTHASSHNPQECMLRSEFPPGFPAYCSDNFNCPFETDICKTYPNTDYGPCCIGCEFGEPLPDTWCGGILGTRCPHGYKCVYHPRLIMVDMPGQCCLRADHDTE